MLRILIGGFIFISGWGAQGREEVNIPTTIKVTGAEMVHLGHLLPTDFDDPSTRQACAQMSLTDAPRSGEKRVVTSHLVASVLRRAKATFPQVFANYHFHIPQEVVIENSGASLSETEIRQGLLSQWRAQCPECQFEIQEISLPRVPKDIEVKEWELVGVPSLPRGSFSVAIRINKAQTDRADHLRFWINGVARILKQVPVVQRNLNFEERVAETDVKFEFRDVTYARDAIPELAALVGRKVKMTKAAGQVLWLSDLAKEKAVARGEWIKVSSSEGPLEISMMAQAESDGFVGDVVRLRNATNKSIMIGIATAKGQVELQ